MFSCLLLLRPLPTIQICLWPYFQHSHISPERCFFVCCVGSIELLLFSLAEVSSGWYQCSRMPQIPGYHGERTTICFASLVVYWSCRLSLLSASLLPPPCFSSAVLSCFVWNRHTYAQYVLRWLQARTVCAAAVRSRDQVGVLLCHHGVRLRGALPALPATKLGYGYSNHSTLYTCGATSYCLTHTQTHTLKHTLKHTIKHSLRYI